MKSFCFILSLAFALPSAWALESPTPAEQFTGLVGHRLHYVNHYRDLAQFLNLSKNDRELLKKDLQKKKLWDAAFRYKMSKTTITIEGATPVVMDFAEVTKKRVTVNGEKLKLNKKNGYRGNLIRLSGTTSASILFPQAHALSRLQPDPEIAALLASAELDEEELSFAFKDGDDPTALLLARYRVDELNMLVDASTRIDKTAMPDLTLDVFACKGQKMDWVQKYVYTGQREFSAEGFVSKEKGPRVINKNNRFEVIPIGVTTEEEREDILISAYLAESCCRHKSCPAAAEKARNEAIAKQRLRQQLESKQISQ